MTILNRLRSAESGSRELDAAIYVELMIPKERAGRIDVLGGVVGWHPKDGPYESAIDTPRYTTSIDAALALVEKMLPGWLYTVASAHTDYNMRPWADVAAPTYTEDGECFESDGATPALAILTALFSSLEAKENAK